MIEITQLNEEFKNYLENSKQQMVSDIKKILTYENIKFSKEKTKANILAFCFEYDYEYMNVIFYGIDEKWNAITEIISLPSQKNSKATQDSKWNSFMPEKIWRSLITIEDNYEGDDWEDLIDEYEKEKYRLFEEWFCSCWKEAKKLNPVTIDAYFSIHDTIFKTNLNTLEIIKEKEILNKYQYKKT